MRLSDIDLLYATLCEENRLLAQFIGLLEQEAELLGASVDIDRLQDFTTTKHRHVDALMAVDTRRQALLAQCGYTVGRKGLALAAAQHHLLGEPTDMLLAFTARAKRLNTCNGITIGSYLSHSQQAMRDLSQLFCEDGLYDARGRRTAAVPRTRPVC